MQLQLAKISCQKGAALIEGLATMVVLLMVLLLATFIGSGYYNLSVMNTAAQNIALNVETQQDRYCQQASSADTCDTAVSQVKNQLANQIAQEAGSHLVFSSGIASADIRTAAPGKANSAPPSLSNISGASWPACAGWGWSDVTLKTNLKLFSNIGNFAGLTLNNGGNAGIPMEAKALSFSFARPSQGVRAGC